MDKKTAFANMVNACHNLQSLNIQAAMVLNQSIEVVGKALGINPDGQEIPAPSEDKGDE